MKEYFVLCIGSSEDFSHELSLMAANGWELHCCNLDREDGWNAVMVRDASAQDVNASLLAACKLAEIQLRFVSFPSHKEEEAINAVLTAITNAEAAQTPKPHEGHNASRAVREASE